MAFHFHVHVEKLSIPIEQIPVWRHQLTDDKGNVVNCESLNSLEEFLKPCDLSNLEHWFAEEIGQVVNAPEREILSTVASNFSFFVEWPKEALLLWKGCVRIDKHIYPEALKTLMRSRNVEPNALSNGPAIGAFLFAGGTRPRRRNNQGWPIHHLYSGEFPYEDEKPKLHSVRDGNHFTQSAGLVAIHPVAHALAEEYSCFAWLLRGHAFNKFGYDPDKVFSRVVNEYGFGPNCPRRVIYPADL